MKEESLEYKMDDLDKRILNKLILNSRESYQEIARELVVSGGTIHVRINKMREAGIIKGSKILLDVSKLGFEFHAFVGINLVNARDYLNVLERLRQFPEVVEVHYTTGQYSLFAKVLSKNAKEFHLFLIEKLQSIQEIQSTETIISLDNPVNKDAKIY
ncbi:Lrp/AsnC ligand binding domain-containing protein [Bacteriovoracales bacterium]|nr:Lrp/AsnC ligand binding domain-containing protein [Bacteriovoracales bacterium]|tara:strand:+ start:748 stop:1221 length:474 start_codon:yes stop_codon:yes gene_type:complete